MSADLRAEQAPTSADDLAGLDALETQHQQRGAGWWARRIWRGTWPKLLAIGLVGLLWQALVWTGWKPEAILPSPVTVLHDLGGTVQTSSFWITTKTTMQRAVFGFAVAVVIGLAIGFAVARFALLRAAIGSLITGLQTMPSIAWFPLAIVLFGGGEGSILFVIVLGAAPSVANGVLAGVDYVSPVLVRAGRNMGASGLGLYRTVIGPASLPAIVAGLKQGWAFAWRSLMAGELLIAIGENGALGARMSQDRDLQDYPDMMGIMIVILIIGILADALFTVANNAIRRRWGLVDSAA